MLSAVRVHLYYLPVLRVTSSAELLPSYKNNNPSHGWRPLTISTTPLSAKLKLSTYMLADLYLIFLSITKAYLQ